MKKLELLLKSIKNNKRLTLLLVATLLAYAAIFFYLRANQISQADIQKYVEPFGWWGLLILIVIQIIFALTPLPDSFMPVLAYLLYGPLGVVVITIGMYLGGLIHYYIGHKLGMVFIVKRFPQITKFLGELSNGNTILKLVYLRMFSVLSFDITSYVAGISNIPIRVYSIAFILGVIPNNFTIMLISSGLFANTIQDQLLIWLLVVVSVTLLAYFYKRSKIKVA